MSVSPKVARSTLVELTHGCAVPICSTALTMRGTFVRHGHVLVGDVALRGLKAKGSWGFDEREVRRAAQTLMDLPVDAQDLVQIELPVSRPSESYSRRDLGGPTGSL
nr:hypothetical protein [Streptomyces sp. FT05W]